MSDLPQFRHTPNGVANAVVSTFPARSWIYVLRDKPTGFFGRTSINWARRPNETCANE